MTFFTRGGRFLTENGRYAVNANCCCGDYYCVRDLHNYHVYSSIFEGDKFYVSKRPDGGDAIYKQASQDADGEWLFCAESIEIRNGNGVYVFLEQDPEPEDIFTIYPQGDSDGYRCIQDCECVHLDGKKCCDECDGRTLNLRCIRSWQFNENTMEFIAAHTDEQKCYDNCGKWYCFADEQCCEDDDPDCDEDTIVHECRFGASDAGNKVSGPYLEESNCTKNCKEPPECPTCVKEACKYLFDPPPQCDDPSTDPPDCEELPGQGGGWANCCDDLRERWRYEDDAWVLLHPCSEDFNAPPGTGTPACTVLNREFPDNPDDNAIVDFPCEIDWTFEPPDDNEACGETGGCGYACVPDENDPTESGCVRDPSGDRKTLIDCENTCPPKWKCTAVNECELNRDGEYETEAECLTRSVQKCGAYGVCCLPSGCEDGYLEQECIDDGGVFYGTSWCDENPCGDAPETGRCCVYSGEQFSIGCGVTRQECIDDADQQVADVTAAGGFAWHDENSIPFMPNPDPDVDCPFEVNLYEFIDQANIPLCIDTTDAGQPVTIQECAETVEPEELWGVFTAGVDCGDGPESPGTCPSSPNSRSSNLVAPP